ncbi:MAG: hypothetical protein AAFY88_23710 [Acidobacteriota bacterium]
MASFVDGINQLGVPFSFVIWIVLICSAAGMVSAFAKELRKFACHRQDLAFKRELLDRGFEPGEVEQVASTPTERTAESEPVRGNQQTEVYYGSA